MANKLFKGTESRQEEMAEAKALRSGRISKAQYMAGEKAEGHTNMRDVRGNANAIASGRVSPEQYAAHEKGERMANGGVPGYTDGGAPDGLHRQYPGFEAPNAPCSTQGPGVRSLQDYKK